MRIKLQLRKAFTSFFLVMFALLSVQAPAFAGVVTTEQLVAEQRADQQRDAVQSFFTREDVQAQLAARGVDAVSAQSRVASMSSSEVSSLYQQIDTMPAGEGGLGLVISLLLIFMLLDIAGVTDIFPGV